MPISKVMVADPPSDPGLNLVYLRCLGKFVKDCVGGASAAAAVFLWGKLRLFFFFFSFIKSAMKVYVNFRRDFPISIYNKPSASFAAIKRLGFATVMEPIPVFNVYFLVFVNPFYCPPTDDADDYEKRKLDKPHFEYRQLVVINSKNIWLSVNDFDFPLELRLAYSYAYVFRVNCLDSYRWSKGGNELLLLDKLFLMLYVLCRQDVEKVRLQVSNFIERCGKLESQKEGVWGMPYIIDTPLQKELYEGNFNFVKDVASFTTFYWGPWETKSTLKQLLFSLRKLKLPKIEYNISLEEYKSFLLTTYHEKTGTWPITNFNERLIEFVETMEELLLLEREIISNTLCFGGNDPFWWREGGGIYSEEGPYTLASVLWLKGLQRALEYYLG